ncbi:MAG: tRNA (adenosine(37)-N6)-threonylcarbamoyltransferase complex ATPase subunit type 1 TsaE [Caldilineales bacterium]
MREADHVICAAPCMIKPVTPSGSMSPIGDRRGQLYNLTTSTMTILISHSAEETESLGEALGRAMQPGDVIALTGDLGAGKTCLTRGIARGLGVSDAVTSPTFILVAEYATRSGATLYHADCYRLGDAAVAEAESIGLAEMMAGDGFAVIEWAERIDRLLPADALRVELVAIDDSQRRIDLHAGGARSRALARALEHLKPVPCC